MPIWYIVYENNPNKWHYGIVKVFFIFFDRNHIFKSIEPIIRSPWDNTRTKDYHRQSFLFLHDIILYSTDGLCLYYVGRRITRNIQISSLRHEWYYSQPPVIIISLIPSSKDDYASKRLSAYIKYVLEKIILNPTGYGSE